MNDRVHRILFKTLPTIHFDYKGYIILATKVTNTLRLFKKVLFITFEIIIQITNACAT